MIETTSYTDFAERLHARVSPDRTPISGSIEISYRCPLDCQHCYNNLPMNDAVARAAEMTTEEHKRLVDQIVDAGCVWLLYTGGEIFARRDFLEIYTHAKRRGLLVTLYTNGTLINERIADHLAEYRPFKIEITLYGGTRETYEKMTRVPGSFDRCHRGIDLLVERGLPLALKTVATSITLHEVPMMRAFAKSRGLDFTYDPQLNPRIDCGRSPLEVRLAPHEAVALDLLDPERESEWQRLRVHFARRQKHVQQCRHGVPYRDPVVVQMPEPECGFLLRSFFEQTNGSARREQAEDVVHRQIEFQGRYGEHRVVFAHAETAIDVADGLADLLFSDRVEGRSRLVEDEQMRPPQKRARDRQPLAFAA